VSIIRTLSVALAILLTGCASGPPGAAYRGTSLVIYTRQAPSNAEAVSREAEAFLAQLGDYLRLRVPPANLLRIYLYRNRWGLWRHLNGALPSLRWKRGACYETPEAYIVALSGNPEKKRFETTLQHELTHYLVAAHFCGIPPWIDEGLAQVMASGPPFPHLEQDLLEAVQEEARRCGNRGCLQLLGVPPGRRLNPSQYRVACALTYWLLSRSPEAPPDALLKFLGATRPGMPPEKAFSESWGVSMEEACEAVTASPEAAR
jgi:hypothetical protein